MTSPDITQIRVGNHRFGIIGLNAAFEKIIREYPGQPDTVLGEILLGILEKKNYIPESTRQAYEKAFIREFRRYAGQDIEDDVPDNLEIKVLGGGCVTCSQLMNTMMEVLNELDLPADLEHIQDEIAIARYKVPGLPAVLMNNEIMSAGIPPLKNEIKKWLTAASAKLDPSKTSGTGEKIEVEDKSEK